MVAGEKEQLKVEGIPVHESEMGALKAPDCAFAVSVKPPDPPGVIVTLAGAAVNDTVGDEELALHEEL